ncbi:MAG TPA: response regulator [Thermoplasmatales archaeon]|nr:response regulator [Thermoplasmatales archaeon]
MPAFNIKKTVVGSVKKTVLVVDDEPDILATVAEILEMNEYIVFTARNGNQCLEKLEDLTPDLILLDIMMPGITTKEILDEIEQDKKLEKTKIIFLTAVGLTETEKEHLLARKHVIDFIQKPFDVDDLLKRVKSAVG